MRTFFLTLTFSLITLLSFSQTTVVDIIVNSEQHDTLEAAVVAAELVETLSGDGPFTVFAPTDSAFAALPDGVLDALLMDPTGELTNILLYHVLDSKVLSADLMDGMTATTVLGKDITVTINDDGVFINDAMVTVADIQADNGVVHVIDAVLSPPPTTVVDIIVDSEDHDTLEIAVLAAGLADLLNTPGPFTVFAPTDAAFAALPEGVLDALLADPSALTNTLLYHVLSGKVLSSDLTDGMTAITFLGEPITVTINDDGVFINNAKVTVADIEADNGVVHVIDAVIMQPTTTVVDIIVDSESHNTLEAAVIAADLVETLSGEGPFTVFAPTDAAFDALPEGVLDALIADPSGALTDVLLYHVLNGKVLAGDLMDGTTATTASGEDVTITINDDGVFINNAKVIVTDLEADNGVVHVVDAVIMQPTTTVVDIIVDSEDHNTLEAAVIAADLVETLSSEGPFTVFAPTDAAFDALPEGLVDALLADPTGDLTDILLYHVLSGKVLSTDLMDGMTATTLLGEDITVTINDNGVFINDAMVTVADIEADNGVVHVINAILLPPADVDGGEIALNDGATEIEICAGDGVSDALDVTLTGAEGSNSAWVITDADANILALPDGPPFDLEGAGAGVCLIWHLSFEDGLTGAEVGANAADLMGTFDLSNPITVTRSGVDGGMISTSAGIQKNRVVIANRASGTISVIDSDTDAIIDTYPMPDEGQPMYCVYNAMNNTVLVGDYNGKVVAFDGKDFSVTGTATAGAGVFHMWISPDFGQLWVNNELDKTVSVIDPTSLATLATIPIPADLADAGFKPHDVIVSPDNGFAFVTVLNSSADENYVIKYDATTFEEVARGAVGVDPHVSLTGANGFLYVASQGADQLTVHNRNDLSLVTTIDIPNAHGLGMNADGTFLYIGNISDGGTNAHYTLDLATNTLVGDPVDAPVAVPHNYAVTSDNGKLFVTHSGGTANQVSVYTLDTTPTLSTTLTVENNPFGLVAYSFTDTEVNICAGDGESDAFDVTLTGAEGSNSAWVITDTDLNILALPDAPPFDLEGAGNGVCLIWHLSFEDGLTGAEVGANAADLDGCFSLSNPITVNRTGVNGGEIALADGTTELEICAGDGTSDAFDVTLTGQEGSNSAWVITDADANILALPDGPPFDLEGAGAGVCLIWHLSFEDGLTGAEVGANAADLDGCFSLSNPITVTRNSVKGGEIALADGTTELEICAGDGVSDAFDVTLTGEEGSNSAWVITDLDGEILGLPAAPPFDLEGAGNGVCLIWHLSFEDGLTGAEVGANAASLEGCFSLSNPITVTRIGVNGGQIATTEGATELEICAGDLISDAFDVTLTGAEGSNSAWVITDADANILALPDGPPFDLEGAGAGVCLIWHLSFEDGLTGAEVGANAADLEGCFSLSNPITVTRNSVKGGEIATTDGETEIDICTGDGISDAFDVTLTGAEGSNSAWVITDLDGEILGLPAAPPFDLEGAGTGVCLIWHLSFEDGLTGAEVGANAAMLQGCFSLSNPIFVNRTRVGGGEIATADGATELEICAGDGVSDAFDVTLTGAEGPNSAWVITDTDGMILGLPDAPPFDLEGAGSGVCLIWHLSFGDGLIGAEVGANANDLEGCYSLSNPITVTRNGVYGGEIATAAGLLEQDVCLNDGDPDLVDVILEGEEGTNSAWVITDSDGNILGLPAAPPFDFSGAGEGVCLIWHLSFEDGLTGAEVGANAADLQGCFSLSNPITINRTRNALCKTPCLPPTTSTATPKSSTSVFIDWPDMSGAFIYIVYYRPVGTDAWRAASVYKSRRTIKNLQPGTVYEYQIQTLCLPEQSPRGPIGQFATPMFAAEVPTNVQFDRNFNDGEVASMEIVPNPVTSTVRLSYNLASDSGTLSITHISGQKVYQTRVIAPNDYLEIDLSDVPSGYYMVTLNNGKEIITEKLVKAGN